MTKVIDMVPDLVNRFMGGKNAVVSEEAVQKAEAMAQEYAAEEKQA